MNSIFASIQEIVQIIISFLLFEHFIQIRIALIVSFFALEWLYTQIFLRILSSLLLSAFLKLSVSLLSRRVVFIQILFIISIYLQFFLFYFDLIILKQIQLLLLFNFDFIFDGIIVYSDPSDLLFQLIFLFLQYAYLIIQEMQLFTLFTAVLVIHNLALSDFLLDQLVL